MCIIILKWENSHQCLLTFPAKTNEDQQKKIELIQAKSQISKLQSDLVTSETARKRARVEFDTEVENLKQHHGVSIAGFLHPRKSLKKVVSFSRAWKDKSDWNPWKILEYVSALLQNLYPVLVLWCAYYSKCQLALQHCFIKC